MLHEARNERVWVPDRNVVDAAQEFLPTTPLEHEYLEWLAKKSEQIPQRPPSYFEPRMRWPVHGRSSPRH